MDSRPPIAVDTETYWNSKLKYSVRNTLPEDFAASHLFDCYLVSASDGKTAWAGSPKDFRWESLNDRVIVCHNLRFDQAIIRRMIELKQIPNFKPKAWLCAAAMGAYLWNRRSLADCVKHNYGVALAKDVRDSSSGKHWPEEFTLEERARMLEYARHDAQWTQRLFADHGHKWPEAERLLANWHIDRAREGVQIDVELLNHYYLETHRCKMATQSLLPWLDDAWDEEGEFSAKPTSTKCIAEQCRRVGIPCPPVKAHEGEEAFQEWESTYGQQHPWIAALSSWRSVNKLLKTFETMRSRIREDGTMGFGQKYCGTGTGRVSGEGQVNLFNQRKQALLITTQGLMEADESKIDRAHKDYKKSGQWPAWVAQPINIRNLIVARPGKQLVTSDLNNIEPRCAAYLAGDHGFLDLIRSGHSPYEAHAIQTMGWDPTKNLKECDPEKYNFAKMRTLSLGYGASWKKLISMAAVFGIDLTKDDPETVEDIHPVTRATRVVSGHGLTARLTVKEYRDANPKIVAKWRALDDSLRSSVGDKLVITLPSGRQMRYEKIRAEMRPEVCDDGKPRLRTVYTADTDGRRHIFYGSKLFAECCQAMARDIFYDAVARLEAAGIPVLLGVYDECVIELDDPARVGEITKIMQTPPEWLKGFPLGTDTKVLARYEK